MSFTSKKKKKKFKLQTPAKPACVIFLSLGNKAGRLGSHVLQLNF